MEQRVINGHHLYILYDEKFKVIQAKYIFVIPMEHFDLYMQMIPYILIKNYELKNKESVFESLSRQCAGTLGINMRRVNKNMFIEYDLTVIDDRFMLSLGKNIVKALGILDAMILEDADICNEISVRAALQALKENDFERKQNLNEYCEEKLIAEMLGIEGFVSCEADKILPERINKQYHAFKQCHKSLYISGNVQLSDIEAFFDERHEDKSKQTYAMAAEEAQLIKSSWRSQYEENGYMVLGRHTNIAFYEELYPALLVYNAVLGGDDASILYKTLRQERFAVYTVYSRISPLDKIQLITVNCKKTDMPPISEHIHFLIKMLEDKWLTEDKIQKSIGKISYDLQKLSDNQNGLLIFHACQTCNASKISLNAMIEKIKNVTTGDIKKVIDHLEYMNKEGE